MSSAFIRRIMREPMDLRHCLYCGAAFKPRHARHIACCPQHRLKLKQNYTPRTPEDDARERQSQLRRKISDAVKASKKQKPSGTKAR